MRVRVLSLVSIILLAARAMPAQEPVLDLSDPPLLEIGVVEGEEPYQLYGAVSSARLADGGVVLLNAGTQEIRYFDAEGGFVRTAGGRGEGPGEFLTPVRLYPLANDSIVVFDRASQRLSLVGPDGDFVRSIPFELTGEPAYPLDTWLYGRYWIEGPVDQSGRENARRSLDALPPLPDGELFRYVHVDRWGRSWIRGSVDGEVGRRPWLVYDGDGSLLARVEMAPTFEIHQVGPNYLLGRARLELDVEVVRVRELDLSPGTLAAYRTSQSLNGPAAGEEADESAGLPPEKMAAIRSSLRVLMMSQESFYADNRTYAGPGDHLTFEAPEGIQLKIVHGDPWGWAGAVVDVESDVMCGVGVGLYVPPGWREGRVLCSR